MYLIEKICLLSEMQSNKIFWIKLLVLILMRYLILTLITYYNQLLEKQSKSLTTFVVSK
jgi:small-conductance mechanosensitive channel